MAERARPTLRCLREDLGLPVPRANTPLDEVSHPLLEKATERFADDQTPQERISSIDDQVLLKVKVQRWRGAVWVDADKPWLVAAGHREEGSPDDFYAALAARAQLRGHATTPSTHTAGQRHPHRLADQGHETYVAIRIIGSVARRLVATVLSLVPGCQLDAWMSDYAMPERAVAPEEQIWSNIMDPAAAAKFLDEQP